MEKERKKNRWGKRRALKFHVKAGNEDIRTSGLIHYRIILFDHELRFFGDRVDCSACLIVSEVCTDGLRQNRNNGTVKVQDILTPTCNTLFQVVTISGVGRG